MFVVYGVIGIARVIYDQHMKIIPVTQLQSRVRLREGSSLSDRRPPSRSRPMGVFEIICCVFQTLSATAELCAFDDL